MTETEVVVAVVAVSIMVIVLLFFGPYFIKVIIPIIRGTAINGSVQMTTGPEILRYRLLTGEVQWYDGTNWQVFPSDPIILGTKFLKQNDVKSAFEQRLGSTFSQSTSFTLGGSSYVFSGLMTGAYTLEKDILIATPNMRSYPLTSFYVFNEGEVIITTDGSVYQRTSPADSLSVGSLSFNNDQATFSVKLSDSLSPAQKAFLTPLDGLTFSLSKPLPARLSLDSSTSLLFSSEKSYTDGALFNPTNFHETVYTFRSSAKAVPGAELTIVQSGPNDDPKTMTFIRGTLTFHPALGGKFTLQSTPTGNAAALLSQTNKLIDQSFSRPLSIPYQPVKDGKPFGPVQSVSVCTKKVNGADLVVDLTAPAVSCS